MSAEDIAKAFVNHFYQTLDSNVDALAGLYTANSHVTFEGGAPAVGPVDILAKLKRPGPLKHQVKAMDIQPAAGGQAIVIFVTGSVSIGGDNPIHFCEMFQLVSDGGSSYHVVNEIFRLNYGL